MTHDTEFAFDDKDFRFLVGLVKERTGIVLSDNKRSMVYSRLARRLRLLGLKTFSAYCTLLQKEDNPEEMAQLVNAITTNLTHFFREGHHFEHLRDEVIRPRLENPGEGRRIRIWSAGCSSGAEPYSIAMTVHQALGSRRNWDCRILATDIDSNMLAMGAAGIYPREMCEKIPSDYQHYAHDITQDQCQMDDALRAMISFKPLNLMERWPMNGPFDAIFCRNVVIYFDKDTQRVLFNRMAELLKPGGWLYVGHSESLHNVCDRFELKGRTIYQRGQA